MGGAVNSAGGFLGLSDGPQAPQGQFGNGGMDFLNDQNQIAGNASYDQFLSNYLQGNTGDPSEILNSDAFSPQQKNAAMNAIATGPMSGTKYATDQVMNNPILGGLYGQNGQLSQAEGKLTDLQNQGFELKPEDQTLYGQTAGNISRTFGQQGNQAANDLASRGLSSSGAAGAAFSGLAGNQNEQLAQAQQQIMQQRFQNTMGQIGQYQNFVSGMGNNAQNAINQQYGRQVQGAGIQSGNASQAAGLQNQANNAQNQYGLQAAEFNQQNKPANFMDYAAAGTGSSIYNQQAAPGQFMSSAAGAGGQAAGKGMMAGG